MPDIRSNIGHAAMTVVMLTLAACASNPPVDVLQAAEAHIRSAQQADAQRHSPEELARAERLLAAARLEMDERNYAQAQRLAERAEVEAELATIQTRRTLARAEVQRKQDENAELRRQLLGPEGLR
jgi:chromosome segregation ATPase